ncbi:hypothetical protein GH714_028594 [Hevea brasiliensis]|uniref:Uncharacterized protein n=1 Tax=Hevea brasiliensis TaxID=3981 RepID=A0A6A6LPW2_HEVBR|nr:hypothetical protein GH714_028594 [Hevea brasiliensis]
MMISYHGAEGKTGDDRVLNGDGGEFEGSNLACKDLSDGAEGVLTNGGEDGRAGQVPEFLGLPVEFSEEITDAVDRRDVIGSGTKELVFVVDLGNYPLESEELQKQEHEKRKNAKQHKMTYREMATIPTDLAICVIVF